MVYKGRLNAESRPAIGTIHGLRILPVWFIIYGNYIPMSDFKPTPRLRLALISLAIASTVLVVQKAARARAAMLARPSVLCVREQLADGRGSVELLSAAYHIDRMYQSMEGPAGNQPGIKLSPGRGNDEVLYVTGVRSEVIAADSEAVISPEFFCHANLTLSPDSTTPAVHNAGFAEPKHMDWRLVTLAPGCMALRLPEGFGVPVKNGTLLDYYTMALNQNQGVPEQTVRIRSRIDYTTAGATRALFRRAVYVHQQYRQASGEKVKADSGVHVGAKCGLSCDRNLLSTNPSLFIDLSLPTHPGAMCCVANASSGGVVPQFGADNTVHWMVPPGKHSYTTDVSTQFDLPFDADAHYITGHLHPYGKRMRLLEKETQRVVFEITSEDFKDKVGVQKMSDIVSKAGVPLRKEGRYELVADYDNTTTSPIDAMAIMYIYLGEKPEKGVIVAQGDGPAVR